MHTSEGLRGLSAPSGDKDKRSGKQMQGREPGKKKQQLKHHKKRPGGDRSSRERGGDGKGEQQVSASCDFYANLLSFALLTLYNLWAASAARELPEQLQMWFLTCKVSDANRMKEQ